MCIEKEKEKIPRIRSLKKCGWHKLQKICTFSIDNFIMFIFIIVFLSQVSNFLTSFEQTDLNITSEQKYVLSLHSHGKSFLNKREIFELCRDTENVGLACTHIFVSAARKATNGPYEFVVEFISS